MQARECRGKGAYRGKIQPCGDEWGGVFQMNPDKVYLTDAEYAEMIEKIKACL